MEDYTIRKAQPEDTKQIIDLITSIYGDSYGDDKLYQESVLRNMIAQEKITIFVCLSPNDELLSLEGCSESESFDKTAILRLKMTLPNYQKLGIGSAVTRDFMKHYSFDGYTSSYAGVLSYRMAAQVILAHYGYKMTGFFINSFVNNQQSSVQNKGTLKRSHIIMVRPEEKKCAGLIHVPKKVYPLVEMIYDSLGVQYELTPLEKIPMGHTIVSVTENIKHCHREVVIRHSGNDLEDVICKQIYQNSQNPLQTTGLFLNVSEEGAVWAFKVLEHIGYRFCGFKPLGTVEYAVFYYSNHLGIDIDSLCVLESNQRIKDMILSI